MQDSAELMHRLYGALDLINSSYHDFYESISANQYEIQVMNSLYNQDNLTQKQIAEAHHMPKQTVNNIILRYQKLGYVEMIRNKEDGQARTIHLTENGRKYVNETLQPVIRLDEVIIERIS